MPTVKGRGQKARLVRGLNLVLRAHSEYDVFNCHVTTRAWAPPLSPPQVLRCGLEAPAPADSLEHGRCGRLGRCPFPVTPSRRDADAAGPDRLGDLPSAPPRPQPALGPGGPGSRQEPGRRGRGPPPGRSRPERAPEASLVLRGPPGSRRRLPLGDTDGYLLASASTAQRPAPLELENVSQRASPPHPRLTHFTLPDPRP